MGRLQQTATGLEQGRGQERGQHPYPTKCIFVYLSCVFEVCRALNLLCKNTVMAFRLVEQQTAMDNLQFYRSLELDSLPLCDMRFGSSQEESRPVLR